MKFIHAADIHLDSPLRGLERYEGAPVEEIRGATRRAFDNLVELAIDEEVEFVLLAGDLYDGDWKDYNTGLYLAARMGRLEKAGIRVFIIAGNHDAASQITRHLRMPANVRVFSTRRPETAVLDSLGVAIHGQGFASRAVTDNMSLAYPQGDPQLFNIGLLHTCLDGKVGHEPYAPCTLDGLRSKGYQYWALGHVHRREVISEDPWIVFPGNIQGRHIRETGGKGCTLVTVEDREVSEVEHRALDVLRWSRCEVDVTGSDDTDEVYDRVRDALQRELDEAEGRPAALRLVLRGASNAHSRLRAGAGQLTQEYRALANGLGGAGIWFEKVIFDTRQPVDADALLERGDAIGGLLQMLRKLELDSASAGGLAEELSSLRQKLPPELLSGEDQFDPLGEKQRGKTLEDVKELLMTHLLATDGD
ncbi:MAG: DNA repair exonuclease [Pseudomonadota bacterium]|nr:DNA repair exonuclease [Pseudomonadota bacterium]